MKTQPLRKVNREHKRCVLQSQRAMIIRTPERERYLVMSKVGLEDVRLSWKAKGLLAYLLSKPDNWNVIVAHLVTQSPEGKASVMGGLSELEKLGYIRRTKKRRDGERFDGIDSEVFEEPIFPDKTASRFSAHGNSVNGKSDTNEELPLMNNEENESCSDSIIESAFEETWKHYPKKKGRGEALKSFTATVRAKRGTLEQLMDATINYAFSRVGQDDQYTVYGKRFFGPGNYWRDFALAPIGATLNDRADISRQIQDDTDWQAELERRHAESTPAPKGFADSIRSMKRET